MAASQGRASRRALAEPAAVALPVPGDAASLEDFWARLQAEVLGQEAGAGSWLRRVQPSGLRDGALILTVRSQRLAGWVRARFEPLLARAAQRLLATPVRVRIEADQTLGGALSALGMPYSRAPHDPGRFLPRPENRVAHGAVAEMARHARPDWDRLWLQGPGAVGKTHLLRLFHQLRHRHFPRERWAFERGLDLFRRFSLACRDRTRGAFRGALLAHDGLILDDLHEISGKLRFQDLLVEVLEAYRERHRLVVVASEGLSHRPAEFRPEFASILRSGMRASIPVLSGTTRAAILQHLFESSPVPAWMIEDLAVDTRRTLPECRELLRRANHLGHRLGRAARREELVALIPELFAAGGAKADPMDVLLDRCAAFTGMPRESITGGSRSRAASLGRHLAVYVAIEVLGMRRQSVRPWLGTLAPSVVPYVRQKIDGLRGKDVKVDGFLREVAEELGQGQRFLFD